MKRHKYLVTVAVAIIPWASMAFAQPAPRPPAGDHPQPPTEPPPPPATTTEAPPPPTTPPTTPTTPPTSPATPPTPTQPPPEVPPSTPAKEEPKEEPKTELKLGGFIMGAAYYDTNNNIVRPWLVRVNGEGDPSVDIDSLPTRLIVTASTKYKGIEGKGHAEFDLKIGDAARIRQVYASVGSDWGSVLVGQA